MPRFSAFAPFGAFAFSSRKPHGQVIYEALRDSQGGAYDTDFETSRQQARLYAQAMCLGSARYQLERAGNQANPLKATEMLPVIEREHQLVPPRNATLDERRATAAARAALSRGARRDAVEEALRLELGDDFVAYETTAQGSQTTWPASPGEVGNFTRADAPLKLIRILGPISRTGEPVTVQFELLVGAMPLPGDVVVVCPDVRGPIEKVTLDDVTIENFLTATFTKAHDAGTLARTGLVPAWLSTQRFARISLTTSAARDPEKRRRVNQIMRRAARGVSQWAIVGQAGTARAAPAADTDRSKLGSIRLG